MTDTITSTRNIGWLRFLLWITLAVGSSVLFVVLGAGASKLMYRWKTLIEGLGFLLFANHLLTMIPLQVFILKATRSTSPSAPGVRSLLERSRTVMIGPGALYIAIASQTAVLAFGLGLVAFTRERTSVCALAGALTVWRFILARLDCERHGSMHLQQSGISSRLSRILNFQADVPWIFIAIWVAVLNGHALWLLGAAQILSYSFLVRAAHYELHKGPATYVSALLSLTISTILLWPVFPIMALDWEGINVLFFSTAGWFYYLIQAFRKTVPLRKRILPTVFCATLGVLTLIGAMKRITIDFSAGAMFTVPALDWQTAFTLLVAFTLPIGLNEGLMQLAEAREWEIEEKGSPRRNPF